MRKQYDVIVVGGGLGGLVSAYILSKKGFKVCVLEKNKHIGGTLQNFMLGDCTFSSGMHYLGSLDEGQVLNKLFRYFNILDKLQLKRMDPNGFDRFSIGNKEYAYPMGWELFREKMTLYYPKEKQAINTYVQLIQEVCNAQDIYNLRIPTNDNNLTNTYITTGIFPAIQQITKNKNLQNALCALNFVYAGDKHTTPLYMHALVNNYFIQSAYRLIGGSGQIADFLAENIIGLGGEIIIKKNVSGFLSDTNGLHAVETIEGDQYTAKNFISNVHPSVTLDMIGEGHLRKAFRNRLSQIRNTISVFGLHLRLKPGVFPVLNYNYYYYKNDDVWAVSEYNSHLWPEFYYLYTPTTHQNNTYTSCVSIYAYMQFNEVKEWANLPVNNRGEEYETWKKLKAQQLINLASIRFPVLRESVIDWITATPLTYRDYIGTPEGAMYGALRDYHNPMSSYVSPKTKIPNLYFTGQNVNLHGMLGVCLSALTTCGEFINLNDLIKEINET